MKRTSRRVDPEELRDLLDHAPRANIAFTRAGLVEAMPVAFRFREGRYWVGIPQAGPGPTPRPNDLVKLLVDDGLWFFELRGIWIRGRTAPTDGPPGGTPAGLGWLELVPEKVVAWHYGTLREVEDA